MNKFEAIELFGPGSAWYPNENPRIEPITEAIQQFYDRPDRKPIQPNKVAKPREPVTA